MFEAVVRALEAGKDLSGAIEEAAAPMRRLVLQALQREPFVPFRLSLTSGHACEIRCPEWVTVTPSVVRLGEPDPAAPGKVRDRCVLALIHIVSLEPLTADEPTVVVRSPAE